MELKVVDTNILVRWLVRDNEAHFQSASALFERAEKKKTELLLTSVVVAETIFVLESVYRQSREAAGRVLEELASQPFLIVPEREALLIALRRHQEGMPFVDAYVIACARVYGGTVATFDKELQKVADDA